MNQFKDKTDDELVEDASYFQKDIGASAELNRRLKESIRSLDNSTSRYSSAIIALTFLLIILGFLQLVLTIFVTPFTVAAKFAVGIVFIAFLLLAGRNIVKAFLE